LKERWPIEGVEAVSMAGGFWIGRVQGKHGDVMARVAMEIHIGGSDTLQMYL
jgi:hypothetical protein